MAAPRYPNIRGKRVDFSSLELTWKTVSGKTLTKNKGCMGLDWSWTRSGKLRFGSNADALGQTRGQLTPSASLKYEFEEWEDMRDEIGDGYGEAEVSIIAVWKENGREGRCEIVGTITGESETVAQDGSPEYTITILPTILKPGGKSILAQN